MRKITSLILSLILTIGIGTNVLASTGDVSSYEKILNSINNEFGLELGYAPVNEKEVTIEEYEIFIRQLATQQREILDKINMNKYESEEKELILINDDYVEPLATVGARRVPVKYNEPFFDIIATYDLVNSKISNLRNVKLDTKQPSRTYCTKISGPGYGSLSGGRGQYAEFTADVVYNNGLIPVRNVSLYAEFTN